MNKIAVVTPSANAYSETFIRAHIERLPAETHVLNGGYLPTYADDGSSLVKPYSRFQRVRFRLSQQLKGLHWNDKAKYLAAIRQYFGINDISVVLAEYGPTGAVMTEICKASRLPLVVHFHGYDAYNEEIIARYGEQYLIMFDYAGAIIAVSSDMKTQLIRLGAPEHKVQINSYGVDTSLFVDANPATTGPVFVATGRFVDKKAPDLTLQAFRQVVSKCLAAQLIMIGDGYLLSSCKRYAKQSRISDSVQFPGVLQHAQVAQIMGNARAFVQHSMQADNGDSEGTPVAILEASASGLPVVSTRHAGIKEAVVDGQTGFLVDEGDVDGMAQAMIRLTREPELAAKMGQAGRSRIEQNFSMDKSIGNLWKIIESVIESSSRII